MDRSHGSGFHGLGRHGPGNPEIRHLNLAVPGNNHILGLDIPVYDMLFMGSADSLCNLDGNADCLLALQMPLFLNVILKGNALNQFHDNIVQHILVHDVVNTDNIRMGQAGRCLGLHLKLAYKIFVKSKFFL